MNRIITYCFLLLICCVWVTPACAKDNKGSKIVHDAEYYILKAQHGKKWAAEDKELNKKLAKLRKKHGAPPNIVHIM